MKRTVEKRLTRSEVPEELTWNLSDLFPSVEAWEAEIVEIEKAIAEFEQFKGTLHTSSKALLACLCAQEELSMKITKAWTYASLKQSADGSDPENQANMAKFSALRTKGLAGLSFINSEILAFEEGTIEQYLQEEPKLAAYKKNLMELLETKKHKLLPETEEALAALGELQGAPFQIYQMTKLADMQFAPIQDADGNELPVSFALFESRYEFSPDTDVRRKAYQSFVSTLKHYKNTMAATYATEVNKQVTLARLRKYDSVIHMRC